VPVSGWAGGRPGLGEGLGLGEADGLGEGLGERLGEGLGERLGEGLAAIPIFVKPKQAVCGQDHWPPSKEK